MSLGLHDQPEEAALTFGGERRSALVAAGKAAVKRGDLQRAIALYTEANRVQADGATERRVVQLRHRAATASRPTAAGRSVWPPSMDDPFPESLSPPQITADELDANVVGGSILHHGSVLVRGLFARDAAARLADAVDRAYTARRDYEAGTGTATPWFDPFHKSAIAPGVSPLDRGWVRDGGGLLAVDSPRSLFLYLQLLDDTGLPAVIGDYLEETPFLSMHKTVFRQSREAQPSWHQDGSFMGSDVRSVNLWLSLSHCGGETNTVGIDLIPRRVPDLLDTGTHGALFPTSIGQGLVDVVCADDEVSTPLFEPGDALLFDERLVHRTSVRPGLTEVRRAVESWFFASVAIPQPVRPDRLHLIPPPRADSRADDE